MEDQRPTENYFGYEKSYISLPSDWNVSPCSTTPLPLFACFCLSIFRILCFRAFGDKTNPPSLPDTEGDGEEVEEEEQEANEGDKPTQEPCPDTERTTEQACSIIEELSLTELEEDAIGKSQDPEEEEEAEQESPKVMQGRCLYAFTHNHCQNTCSPYCHGVVRKGLFLDLNRNHLQFWMSCFCQHVVLFRPDSRKVSCCSEKVACNSKWHMWPVSYCDIAENMDALLLQCFLHALKIKVKKSELPLLTSTFLRNHMFSCW